MNRRVLLVTGEPVHSIGDDASGLAPVANLASHVMASAASSAPATAAGARCDDRVYPAVQQGRQDETSHQGSRASSSKPVTRITSSNRQCRSRRCLPMAIKRTTSSSAAFGCGRPRLASARARRPRSCRSPFTTASDLPRASLRHPAYYTMPAQFVPLPEILARVLHAGPVEQQMLSHTSSS